MSEWAAIEPGGEPIDAWTFRTRFKESGEEYKPLYCPFCDIEIIPCAIFDRKEFSVPPYFRTYEELDHINGCNGDPFENDASRRPPQRRRMPNEMDIPLALIDRPYRISVRKDPRGASVAPSVIETISRRTRGKSLPSPTPKTSLVMSIARAYDRLMERALTESRNEGLDSEARKDRIKSVLSEVPLRLEDPTNYYGGIINPLLFVKRGVKRIYKVKEGICVTGDSEFVLSAKCAKYEEFRVVVPGAAEAGAPRSHHKLIDELGRLARTGLKFRFFAYGGIELQENVVVLQLEKLDHLFISRDDDMRASRLLSSQES